MVFSFEDLERRGRKEDPMAQLAVRVGKKREGDDITALIAVEGELVASFTVPESIWNKLAAAWREGVVVPYTQLGPGVVPAGEEDADA
jgi:hypothetical protein